MSAPESRDIVGAVGFGCSSPVATKMKNGRTVLEWQRPLAFLAAAPLGWVTPLGQIIHFAGGATICAGNQLAEWAFLVVLMWPVRLGRTGPGWAYAARGGWGRQAPAVDRAPSTS